MIRQFSVLTLAVFMLFACTNTSPENTIQQITPLPTDAHTTEVIDTIYADPLLTIGLSTPRAIETVGLAPGIARAQALEDDITYRPDLETPITFEDFPVRLQFSEFYDGYTIRAGLILSDKLQSLDGQQVTIDGYVAPPLAPRLDFFVLTRIKLTSCPFCSRDAEWPNDIVLVYLPELQTISSDFVVRITGTLHVGTRVDAETGMVSLVRIYADTVETLD